MNEYDVFDAFLSRFDFVSLYKNSVFLKITWTQTKQNEWELSQWVSMLAFLDLSVRTVLTTSHNNKKKMVLLHYFLSKHDVHTG